jgi:hypothetical protein
MSIRRSSSRYAILGRNRETAALKGKKYEKTHIAAAIEMI